MGDVYHRRTSNAIFGAWLIECVLAYIFGIAFQYFSIKPGREDYSFKNALLAAIKADTLSLNRRSLHPAQALCITLHQEYGPVADYP